MKEKNKVLWEKGPQSLDWVDREGSLGQWLVSCELKGKEELARRAESSGAPVVLVGEFGFFSKDKH